MDHQYEKAVERFNPAHKAKSVEFTIIHPSVVLKDGVVVWHFTTIEAGVIVGKDTVIGGRCFIGAGTRIGKNCRIQDGVFIPRGSTLGDNVFIGPGVVFTDDRYPVSGNTEYKHEAPVIEDGASIGAGSVILPGVRIGRQAMVGAGSVITKDVLPGVLVYGDSAKEKGFA